MPTAPSPHNEADRLAALRSYDGIGGQCTKALNNVASMAARFLGCPIALVSLVDGDTVRFEAGHGLDAASLSRNEAFCSYAILNPLEPLVVLDPVHDPRFADNPLVAMAGGIRFYAGIPLVNPEGFPLGTLCILDHQPHSFTDGDRDVLAKLAETALVTLELQRALKRVQHLALTDILTGIANRVAFLDALNRAIARQARQGSTFTVLYLDLDGVKCVNDQHGHLAGDDVLRTAADTLCACLRTGDMTARLGGDEFAALLEDDPLDGTAVGERVRTAIEAKMKAAGWPVTASIGVVTFHALPKDAAEAVAVADAVMYRAKVNGKNRVLYRNHVPRGALGNVA